MALPPLMLLPRGANLDRVVLDEQKLVDFVAKFGWEGGKLGHGHELKSTRSAQTLLSSQRGSIVIFNVLEEYEHQL
jgi:hypothetical protein